MSVEDKFSETNSIQLLIAPMGEAALRHSALLARDIRAKGAVVELAPDGKLKRLLELANKIGAQQTLIVGDNEIASGAYALKNMTSGEQTSVSREDLLNRF
jgi:histidyl-tRNA synthetase